MGEMNLLNSPDDIDLDQHGVIEAHAGTGKTYTIIQTVLRILERKTGEGDGFIARRAESAAVASPAPGSALLAALSAEVTLVAFGALVDGAFASGPAGRWRWDQRRGRLLGSPAVAGSAAPVGTVGADPTGW